MWTVTAEDMVATEQGEKNFSLAHRGVGLFVSILALVAAVLGVVRRDRGQLVFAALFAWLAIGEWLSISPSLPAGLASAVWPPGVYHVSGARSRSWPQRSCYKCANERRAGTAP